MSVTTTEATAPAISSRPSMIEASISTTPARLAMAPVPATTQVPHRRNSHEFAADKMLYQTPMPYQLSSVDEAQATSDAASVSSQASPSNSASCGTTLPPFADAWPPQPSSPGSQHESDLDQDLSMTGGLPDVHD